jgi:SAM-dependent methyltransferase
MKAAVKLWKPEEPAMQRPARIPNFDRLARVYRWMEWLTFGPFLWRCRCAFIPQLRDARPRQALVIGDGDGRFTARLLAEDRLVNVEAVDVSQAMLAQLQRNARHDANRIHIHCADVRTWNPASAHYDLIITHFFLDCLSTGEVAALAMRLQQCVTAETRWVVSEFAVPRNRFGRMVAEPLITCLYLAFRMLTGLEARQLPDHRRALTEAGFTLACTQESLCGLLISELWKPGKSLSASRGWSESHCAD